MSSPPVDPWSGQPDQGQRPGHPPYGGPSGPPAPPFVPGARPPAAPWPGGGQPAPTTPWPAAGQPGNQPTSPGAWPGATPPAPPQRWGTPARPEDQPTEIQPRISSGRTPPGAFGTPPQSGAYPGGQPYAGQPGSQSYGDPSFEGPPGAPPAKKSRLPLVLSLALVGILVLCLGGGGLAYVALSGDDEPAPVASSGATPGATPSTGPSNAESAPAETPSGESSEDPRIRLVTPKSLGGRPKSTDPELKALADQMVSDMKSTVSRESGAVGAFYGSPEKQNIVMVVGASGFVLDPEKELNDAVKGVTTDLSVRKMATVSPGPLGGLAKCGEGESSDIPLGVCVWADQGSVGMIVMFFSSGAKAKSEFVSIRGQIEKRS